MWQNVEQLASQMGASHLVSPAMSGDIGKGTQWMGAFLGVAWILVALSWQGSGFCKLVDLENKPQHTSTIACWHIFLAKRTFPRRAWATIAITLVGYYSWQLMFFGVAYWKVDYPFAGYSLDFGQFLDIFGIKQCRMLTSSTFWYFWPWGLPELSCWCHCHSQLLVHTWWSEEPCG